MPMFDYVWLCMTMYDHLGLCMTMYGYVWSDNSSGIWIGTF